jgi:hypothetical protein
LPKRDGERKLSGVSHGHPAPIGHGVIQHPRSGGALFDSASAVALVNRHPVGPRFDRKLRRMTYRGERERARRIASGRAFHLRVHCESFVHAYLERHCDVTDWFASRCIDNPSADRWNRVRKQWSGDWSYEAKDAESEITEVSQMRFRAAIPMLAFLHGQRSV